MPKCHPAAIENRRSQIIDRLAKGLTLAAGLTIVGVAVLLIIRLYTDSEISRNEFGWKFLIARAWDPVRGKFGALPFVYGTLFTSAVALALALPLGLGASIFLAELAPPKLSSTLAFLIELLAAVPSVIYGLLGILLIVPLIRTSVGPLLQSSFGFMPLFQGPVFGVGFLAAGFVLAIMVLPFIVSVSREAFLTVPNEQREAALALGATRWEAAWQVIVPHARLGILSSLFLSLARALGETMAVTMVIGNSPRISASLLSPGYSIAAVVANEFMEAASELHVQALIELALVLFLITAIVNGCARLILRSSTGEGR
jgi:phosphate transport system permease protein